MFVLFSSSNGNISFIWSIRTGSNLTKNPLCAFNFYFYNQFYFLPISYCSSKYSPYYITIFIMFCTLFLIQLAHIHQILQTKLFLCYQQQHDTFHFSLFYTPYQFHLCLLFLLYLCMDGHLIEFPSFVAEAFIKKELYT